MPEDQYVGEFRFAVYERIGVCVINPNAIIERRSCGEYFEQQAVIECMFWNKLYGRKVNA